MTNEERIKKKRKHKRHKIKIENFQQNQIRYMCELCSVAQWKKGCLSSHTGEQQFGFTFQYVECVVCYHMQNKRDFQ